MTGPWLRLVLAVSLDGRLAPAEGGAAQLGGAGDRRRLEESLAWADVALLGAQTVRVHGTSCLIHAPDLLRRRRERSQPPQPPVLVWSRSGRFPSALPFFAQPFERWLLTEGEPKAAPSAEASGFGRILPFVDWQATLAQLWGLGVRRVAVLGGAQLAGALAQAGLLDELHLTLCPRLLGGTHLWLPTNATSDPSIRWTPVEHAALAGGDQLVRYVRQPARDRRALATTALKTSPAGC